MPSVQPDENRETPRPRLIWGLWGLSMLLMLVGVISTGMTWTVDVGERWGFRGLTLAMIPVYGTMGALIVARHPRHLIGWLLFYTGAATALQHLVDEYTVWALLVRPNVLPGALLGAWITNWSWLPVAAPLVLLLPLFYPNGQLPSPRWRPVAALGMTSIVALILVWMLLPGPMESSFMFLDNPYAWAAGADLMVALQYFGYVGALTTLALGLVALLVRLRHAGGVERQQLKWFLYAAAVNAVSVFGAPTSNTWLHILFILTILGLGAAVGAAILRYRLYDLDLLINRTLVYAGLTATLAVLYFGTVLLLQTLFFGLTGEGQSQLVTVLSTLTIAALFSPVRSRLQRFIDRRFFRKKYDAAQTLAAFSATLRDETDLARLRVHMVQVIDEAMQPAQVSLWLKE